MIIVAILLLLVAYLMVGTLVSLAEMYFRLKKNPYASFDMGNSGAILVVWPLALIGGIFNITEVALEAAHTAIRKKVQAK